LSTEQVMDVHDDFDEYIYPLNSRACHDCGTPTTDFRCPSCREKHLKRLGYPVTPISGYYDEPYSLSLFSTVNIF